MSETEYGFEIFHWRGQKRYRCNQTWESGTPCEFDTYDLEAIREHAREPHTRTGKPVEPPPARVSPILDESGKHIIVGNEKPTPPEFSDFRFKE
jgi:hypothetical protein